ncbi:unnamed protein product [Angiostrongylus costaricensis]|uniref:HTH_48 domain-containing protein n=1 Tax=Angiostrongylus costaricensis TaxID=334426 RepID=A0A0R3PU08_ANGCS|nr:unnamed protein product [Angiostrongylus costaricensis]
MFHISYFYVLLLVISAAAESQLQHPNEHVMNEDVAKILPFWTDVKRARNPYSWMAVEQGMGGSNPYSWMTQMSKTNFAQIFLYEFKLGGSAEKTARNIEEVWGESNAGVSAVQTWFRKFQSGDFDLEDEEGRGCPNELNDDEFDCLQHVMFSKMPS